MTKMNSMTICAKEISIKDIFKGFVDNGEDGVFAYGGKLTIRPPYQREFVYDKEQQRSVINTILKKFPLNTMYWVKTGKDTYEVLDGQQRTLSVMSFLSHKFDVDFNGHKEYFDGLPEDIYKDILNYKFMIYICEGNESEKLEWFRVVNIAGEKLTNQELRNSVYTGTWLSDAKRYFSKRNCVAKKKSDKYIKGDPIRQELLEKALFGISQYQGLSSIEEYMSKHKNDKDANELWQYFQDVIDWIEKHFATYYSDMTSVDWFNLFNKYSISRYNTKELDKLSIDLHTQLDEITKSSGIYEYLLDESNPFREKYLNLRQFELRDKKAVYIKQKGKCAICKKPFELEEMEGDHIKPWSQGGKTVVDNLQMLCKDCNRQKSNK